MPQRRLPVGAEIQPDGTVHFRVWAPRRRRVVVVEESDGRSGAAGQLKAEGNGYFSGIVALASAGTIYRYRLDDEQKLYPDPASRFQPEGVHGPSQVIDPGSFRWTDRDWSGVSREGQVIYEMHIGTFTPKGTWEAAIGELAELASLGVTVLEIMPVAEFPGRFGWGYDGVDLFAPTRLYGTPDDFRRFVNRAHAEGLGVILDVVYNHLGPDGNYLKQFSEDYFTDRYKNEWGEAINFDGDNAGPVREFFLANATYWLEEFHIDGLRLDATQQVFDSSPQHILAEITRSVRGTAKGRSTFLVAENEPQLGKLVRPFERGGYGIDALWNDDFHHSAMVALSGHNEAYYSDYRGSPQEFLSALKWGFLYQGQRHKWQKKRRGSPVFDLPPSAFIIFLQNHDQVANSGRGQRCHALSSPGRFRALTASMMLSPNTPMLFQGQEFAASSPFFYFADHKEELAKLVQKGRGKFLSQFPTLALPETLAGLANPSDPATFARCKLDFTERQRHAEAYALHRDLLRLRHQDSVFRLQRRGAMDGAVLSAEAFVLRFFGEDADDRLLVVNLGRDLHLDPAPEPLLAPPDGTQWGITWSSEARDYGGNGTPPLDTEENWRIPGQAAIALSLRDTEWEMNASFVRQAWTSGQSDREALLSREWLVTNGLGGYSSGTIAGAATRRYHGVLIAHLPAPFGRMVLLNHLSEFVRLQDGRCIPIGAEERTGGDLQLHGADHLAVFRLESGLPVWRYELGGVVFEKTIFMPHQQNSVQIQYRLVAGESLCLMLRPSVHFRGHDSPVGGVRPDQYGLKVAGNRYELAVEGPLPPLKLWLDGRATAFTMDSKVLPDILYRVEESRGYDAHGDLWSPGYFQADLTRDQEVTLRGSTESWVTILAMTPSEALNAERERRSHLIAAANPAVQGTPAAEWVLAADQFLITPVGRVADSARAHAAGDEARTIIAGYHWFTDWGRDTMISLEGLTLMTGRQVEAGYILRTFADYVRDGLIPNLFPEGENKGLYHTADATLWFFHALDRYLTLTGDRATLQLLLPRLLDIVELHQRGTHFGIGVDPTDGLLRQGAEGFQLTWMDAKVGNWVVTPRRGKAVEINALWFNALKLLEGWVRQEQGDDAAQPFGEAAEQARRSFNKRFWCAEKGYLFDVVDGEHGDDPACRPNQIFAMSLRNAILDPRHWLAVLGTVKDRLLTPYGLRSLAPGEPDYKPKYYGDLRARDAAYHQGTVWAWLIGPFIDAWLRVHPDDRLGARRFLESFEKHLGESCIGSISEIFDAEKPYTPRGCIAQAWSVAEVLRCWVKTAKSEAAAV